jgi:DNA repair protein RAD50
VIHSVLIDANTPPVTFQLESFLSEIPNTLTANETNLQNAITLKKKLESLRPHWSRAHSLLTEHVPNLHLQQQKFTNDFREANEILQTKKAALESKNKEVSELEKLLQNTEQILQHFNEFNRFSTAAETEAKNISLTVPESQSLEEITKELTNCQNMSMEYTHTLEELQKEMQLKKENIMSCESNLMQMEKQILQMQNVRQTITQLNRRYEEIQTALQQSQSEVGKLQSQMEATQTAIQEKNRQRESMLIEATAKDEKLQKAKEKFSQSLVKLQLAEQQIQKLSKSSNIEEEISTLTTEKRKLEEKLEQVNAEMKRCSEQLLTLRKLLANKDQLKRNLEDNLRFREEKQKLNEIEQNLNQKKEKLQEYDKNTILENISSLDTRIESLKSKLNQCLGAKNAYLEQLKTQQLELKKPHYIHADDEYRKAFVKLKTTEMIASDLDKYYKALDKALVKYHASKMEEINKIIKDLWQTTYKGDDISTIEIRADSEEASGRRNYNYRVVMLKGDTELDMRGRCSAGQKVLASLIIRLALAEAFCLNCGILALDEPTTNLDRQNMESFAKALVNIIENRRQQQNFQLIIITHDEEFVQLLGRSEHADYYWRVKKDPQSGHSVIVQVPIDNL